MTAKVLIYDIERLGALQDDVWEGKQFSSWIGPEKVIEPSRTITMAYRWTDETKTRFISEWDVALEQDNTLAAPGGGHRVFIEKAWELLDTATYAVGWNSKNFDTRHLQAAFFAYGMKPPSPHIDIDLMLQCRKNFQLPSKSLAYVSKMRGLDGKMKHDPLMRRKLRYADGEVLRRARRECKKYNIQDVDQTYLLYRDMLPWLSGMNLGLYEDDDQILCGNCGSDHLQYRGVAGNRTYSYRRFVCCACGRWGRDRRSFKSTETVGI